MNTPITELLPLHQDLIKSWATKRPLASVERKASDRAERDRQNLERAIADYLSTCEAATGKLITRFGSGGKAEAVLDAIAQLKKKGAIEYGHNFKWRTVVNEQVA